MTSSPSSRMVEQVFRAEYGAVLATLIRQLGDFDAAEDALAEALVVAVENWAAHGVPDRPGAWLLTCARRKAIDRLRRDRAWGERATMLRATSPASAMQPEPDAVPDDQLRLIFTCCHPSLATDAQVALTLRTLGGLETAEIARAFLVPTATMAQRLVRAKQKIRQAQIPYRVPPPELWPERLRAVLAVVYLIFNEGYFPSSGTAVVRHDLCDDAIRLARILAALLPREPEVRGLLALLLLQDARRRARQEPDGTLVLLGEQDRTLWDTAQMVEGRALVQAALRLGHPGPYQLQAAIAAVHSEAACAGDTDWRQIRALYRTLHALSPTPVVALNWAVAIAEDEGPAAALAHIEPLAAPLARYAPFHAARADFLRRAGRGEEARAAYQQAAALTDNGAERAFYERAIARLGD